MIQNQELEFSLCIPTNGVVEWVMPVLDSIYNEKFDEGLFEVVVMDNGSNQEFHDAMIKYVKKHDNLSYYQTNASGFKCQIEAFKKAEGKFVKFLNHRMIILPGFLSYLHEFVKKNEKEKSIIYFSNGVLNDLKKEFITSSFDEYVKALSYWSSWSVGLAFWKEDFDALQEELSYSELFPHMVVLFMINNNRNYIICNQMMMKELPTDNTKKGRYNLFYAFAVEYPSILHELLSKELISIDTFLKIKSDLLMFLCSLYIDFVIKRKKSSYILDDYKKYIQVYYSMGQLKLGLLRYFFHKLQIIMRK